MSRRPDRISIKFKFTAVKYDKQILTISLYLSNKNHNNVLLVYRYIVVGYRGPYLVSYKTLLHEHDCSCAYTADIVTKNCHAFKLEGTYCNCIGKLKTYSQ